MYAADGSLVLIEKMRAFCSFGLVNHLMGALWRYWIDDVYIKLYTAAAAAKAFHYRERISIIHLLSFGGKISICT